MGGVGPHRVCTQFRLCVFFSAEGSDMKLSLILSKFASTLTPGLVGIHDI